MVGYLERIGTLLLGLLPFRRAAVFDDAHFTVEDVPDTPIVGSTGAEGAVTGYTRVRLAPDIVSPPSIDTGSITTGTLVTSDNTTIGGTLTVTGGGNVLTGPTQIGGTWFDEAVPVTTTDATPRVIYVLPVAASTYLDLDVSIVAVDSTNSKLIRLRRLGFAGRGATGDASGISFQEIGTDDDPLSEAVADAIFGPTSMSFRVTGPAATTIRWMFWLSWRVYA